MNRPTFAILMVVTSICLGVGALTLAAARNRAPAPESRSTPAMPTPVDEKDTEKDTEGELLRRLSLAEGLLRLGKHQAASDIAENLPARGPHQEAALHLRAWAMFGAGTNPALAGLLADADGIRGELLFLRGAARWRAGQQSGLTDLRALWWGEPDSAWGLAAARELASPGPGLRSPYDAKTAAILLRHIPSVEFDTALRAGQVDGPLHLLARSAGRRGLLAAEVHHALGVAALRAERFSDATAALRKAMASTDRELTRVVELRLGEAERRRGRYEAAQRHFARVAGGPRDRFSDQALALAGQMAIEYRRYPDARRLFETQLVSNPVGPARHEALWGLGWVAFRTGDFAAAQRFFSTLVAESSHGELSPRALFWWARTLEERGALHEARQLFATVEHRFPADYYAYRARQWRGQASLGPAVPAREVEVAAVVRVRALLQTDMIARARADLARLRAAAGELAPEALTALERAAEEAGAPELGKPFRVTRWQRFPTSAEALAFHQERFPSPYVEQLTRAAKEQRISADLPAALVRQESGFRARAVSPVGALGLMQLMPTTGRELWQEEKKRKHPSTEQLLDPENNIRLGVRYLGRMLRAFDRRTEYALAAYNAGPGAVTRWRQARGDLPTDIFAEEIPYAETRDYVRRVLANAQVLWLIGQGPAALAPPAPTVAVVGPSSLASQP